MRKALIDKTTNFVVNVIMAEDDWQPPEGYIVVTSDTADLGDTWDGERIIPHPQNLIWDGTKLIPRETPLPRDPLAEIDQIKVDIQTIKTKLKI